MNGVCQGFNVFFERDPSLNPAEACPNPAADTNTGCTLWDFDVGATTATNTGAYRTQFQVVITGSKGYNTNRLRPALTNFTGPSVLPAAFGAPLSNGVNDYVGFELFQNAFDVTQCAVACQAKTASN